MNTTPPDVVTTTNPDDENPEDNARSRSLSLGGGSTPGVSLGKAGKAFEFLASVREEMRKVTWPTRRMVITESVVVVVFVIFFTCLIVGLDRVFALLFNAILFGK
ncbi:MAG: SecE/Sec61-gamma subunit of protein translocation complex [Cyanobacteria bacterium RYN_339]|nr:SecE/Sec61-gamma subunit of protein translocation complex [Cyanobacteria bacterium RYN_339]